MKEEILVFDDDPNVAERWSNELKELEYITRHFEPSFLTLEEFNSTMKNFMTRQSEYRKDEKGEFEETRVDNAAAFLIDFNLLDIEKNITITGETVAYLTRCFSTCDVIIGINQFLGASTYGTNSFDLTMLRHPLSFCDINMGNEQIYNRGLWDDEYDGFRPWYWPMIPGLVEKFKHKCDAVATDLDTPIANALGFNESIKFFPDSITNFFGSDPTKITFRDFVLKSGNGINRQDKNIPDENIVRVAASRISKWLETIVLHRQDILVDAPHLVSRFPSLIVGDKTNIETWNGTTKFHDYKELNINYEAIEKNRFIPEFWLSRAAWYWEELSKDENIHEVSNPWEREEVNVCFCEDISKFIDRENCQEYSTDFDSPYKRRYIKKELFEDVEYRPRMKLISN